MSYLGLLFDTDFDFNLCVPIGNQLYGHLPVNDGIWGDFQ